MQVTEKLLEQVAVDSKELATNFSEIGGMCVENLVPKNEIQNRFPLATWLLNTPLSNEMRRRVLNRNIYYRKVDGKVMVAVPQTTVWSELPASTSGECCWVLPDFDSCSGEVPVNLLCLKDCDDMLDTLMGRQLRYTERDAMPPIAYAGESVETVNKRIARMFMAFYTARNIIQGLDNTYTDQLKPFHGLLQVLENPAVIHIAGESILAAFAEIACRMAVIGYDGFVFAAHPLVIESIKAVIQPDEYNRLPVGWAYVDGELRFHGTSFIPDKSVPFSIADGTGEVWLLHRDVVGAFLGTDLMPAKDFIFSSANNLGVTAEGCGGVCDYYYNYGSVFNTDARKLAVITGVPASTECLNATADLANLLVPQTLIPA